MARVLTRISIWIVAFLCSTPVQAQSSVWGDEEPAYNGIVARSFLIEVQPLVERFVGCQIGAFPKYQIVTRAEYAKALAPSIAVAVRAKHPGMTEQQALSLSQEMVRESARGLLGKYDFQTKTIYLLPGNLKPMLQAMNIHQRYTRDLIEVIIAHEMTHAVQDAKFPMKEALARTAGPDAFEAYAMMIEGHACFIQELVAKELKLDESAALLAQRMTADNERETSPDGRGGWDRYVNGKRFVDAIYKKGGDAAVQALFAKPPISRAVVMNPDLYGSGTQVR